ncbi:valine--tRNA ligase, putative [Plasmodium knowlesi strain H]|uniref:valine--tRNA ligase n=3 Tax=Plasmodium knowlesi TaxID=5850 RepID=A0A5K1UV69_PLAKH|nr:valine--tRNA ligase, putative [Plasmodium knowlesi strain H]OTN65357.1 putative Valine--tRNA ligase [Plasmodium knowlesi]CAA9989526.1 valine--tRNA ligase, putative [Plasmodium knowlesi strain H]SBO22518.1 valine--tRNA ligase, putative [Plasmodium knowlesi strain H]SBO23630.1 valine--tRNA ligase, putative [Plasmodium knowlesi strain H]VVS79000.1 valine--tRNA ligase, putative [Plasmodium knowlesi strain H]|eukprot:XP_002260251.1 valine-tRNA ligase, putative [Plasmodium knowlesi strain H]
MNVRFPKRIAVYYHTRRYLHCTLNKMEGRNIKENLKSMKDAYDPKEVESKWYSFWEQNDYFKPKKELLAKKGQSDKFVIVLPPPNVTGTLHIGHTLTIAIQDALVRYKRMKNLVTLYIPGTDHAGIATQTVVEKMLFKKEQKIRQDYGREEFVKKIHEWKDLHGNKINNQIRRIGASVDWSREYFTMNDKLSVAVKEAFIKFYDSGLIYRDNRLVAWCPHLKTALSDIEVNLEEIKKPTKIKIPSFNHLVEVGVLYKFFYQIKGSEEKIEVATTRIETMLGDVAVAVHPNDKRYAHLVGKEILHPFIPDRKVIIIADSYVDMEYGTGAVKITPAHDKNDFEMMKRHNLKAINIFTRDGHINRNGGKLFEGLHRFECRFKIQEELKKLNLLSDKIPNAMSLPLCSRTNDIIEYMLIPQWYVNCSDLAKQAINCVKEKQLTIIPMHHVNTWFYWLENVRDWCISRQLWWGHRIPAYRIVKKGDPKGEPQGNGDNPNQSEEVDSMSQEGEEKWVVGRSHEECMEKAKNMVPENEEFELVQDEDVLDTWFSSALVPFSSLGWPEKTEDLEQFFPNSILETGQDILFFWVARMVMVSLHLMNTLPFNTIYLHAMIRDSKGEKMSKSKGNVVDPLDIIDGISLQGLNQKLYEGNLPEKEIKRALELQKKEFPKGIPECGTDALRFGLLTYLKQGRNVNLDINRIIGYRHFCNKLWNAVKFFLKTLPDNYDNCNILLSQPDYVQSLQWEDKWILHRLNVYIKSANESFDTYNFSEAAFSAYNFWLYDLCDVYLELIKARLNIDPPQPMKKEEALSEGKREDTTAGDNNVHDNNAIMEGNNLVASTALHASKTLHACLDYGLRLMHPISPFITEELYHKIAANEYKFGSISVAPYPEYVPSWNDEKINSEMNKFMSIVKQFRSFISNLEIPPKIKLNCFIAAKNEEDECFIVKVKNKIQTLAKLGNLTVIKYNVEELSCEQISEIKKCLKDIVANQFIIYVQSTEEYLKPLLTNMQNKNKKLQSSLDSYLKKTNDPNYEEKVPEQVRNLYAEKIEELNAQILAVSNIISEINECLKNA